MTTNAKQIAANRGSHYPAHASKMLPIPTSKLEKGRNEPISLRLTERKREAQKAIYGRTHLLRGDIRKKRKYPKRTHFGQEARST